MSHSSDRRRSLSGPRLGHPNFRRDIDIHRHSRLRVEALEDRRMLAVIAVTSQQ